MVARLMPRMGPAYAMRSAKFRTAIPDLVVNRPADLVGQGFAASRSDELRLADLPCVATWRQFVYPALVIDAFSRRIVEWRVSSSLRTGPALVALEQAPYARPDRWVHPGDRETCAPPAQVGQPGYPKTRGDSCRHEPDASTGRQETSQVVFLWTSGPDVDTEADAVRAGLLTPQPERPTLREDTGSP